LAKAELKDVLSKNIPPRILADYENRKEERIQLEAFYWAKSVRPLNSMLSVLYRMAVKINGLRNKLKK
jgi:hypothetical protein